ncbi:MAG: hypothetical protein IKT43_03465 [Clostridia bacterium]|nr:hypothetical protein [Clostridia bacterium]
MSIFQVLGVLFLTLVLVLMLKELRVRYSILFSAAALIVFLLFSLEEMKSVLSFLTALSEKSGYTTYFTVLLKSLGIALSTGFLAELCRDMGEGALSRAAELCGKGAILSLAFPVLKDFLDLIARAMESVE